MSFSLSHLCCCPECIFLLCLPRVCLFCAVFRFFCPGAFFVSWGRMWETEVSSVGDPDENMSRYAKIQEQREKVSDVLLKFSVDRVLLQLSTREKECKILQK